MPLVELTHVTKTFSRGHGVKLHAVNDVSLTVEPGETLGLIGESGAGKSTVGRLAIRLQEPDDGTVFFDNQDLATLDKKALQRARAKMTVVFQEPYQSLNPRMKVGEIVEEPLVIHQRSVPSTARRARVVDALEHVALGSRFLDRYPHELSGGQQQRVGVARAIVTRPRFIVLDEPTSSLDLSVRAQILELLRNLQREYGLAFLFISHDIHSVEHLSTRLSVMYLGQIVETGPTQAVFNNPRHPYTQALLSAALSADPDEKPERFLLRGEIPSPTELPVGCFLYGRCPIGSKECAAAPVLLQAIDSDREVACIKA